VSRQAISPDPVPMPTHASGGYGATVGRTWSTARTPECSSACNKARPPIPRSSNSRRREAPADTPHPPPKPVGPNDRSLGGPENASSSATNVSSHGTLVSQQPNLLELLELPVRYNTARIESRYEFSGLEQLEVTVGRAPPSNIPVPHASRAHDWSFLPRVHHKRLSSLTRCR